MRISDWSSDVCSSDLMTFLPVRLTSDAYTSTEIGLIATGHAAGFLVGCLVVGRVIRAVGHIRAFATLAAAISATALAFATLVAPLYTMITRPTTGFSSAGLVTVAQSPLPAQPPQHPHSRPPTV